MNSKFNKLEVNHKPKNHEGHILMSIHIYVFLNENNAIFNDSIHKADTNYPQPISNDWPNLPIKFQRHIDDVINM